MGPIRSFSRQAAPLVDGDEQSFIFPAPGWVDKRPGNAAAGLARPGRGDAAELTAGPELGVYEQWNEKSRQARLQALRPLALASYPSFEQPAQAVELPVHGHVSRETMDYVTTSARPS